MRRRPPKSTRTDTRFPYTTLFRSDQRRLSRPALGSLARQVRADLSDAVRQRRAHAGDQRGGGARQRAHERGRHDAVGLVCEAAPHPDVVVVVDGGRSEEHTSELQSLMRISYAVFCLKKKKKTTTTRTHQPTSTPINTRRTSYKHQS